MPVSAVATAREWDDTESFSSFSGTSFSSGPKSSTYKKEKKGPRDPFLSYLGMLVLAILTWVSLLVSPTA